MTQALVGYKLIDVRDESLVQSWGGVWGACPGIPNPVMLPNGDHVHAPSLGQIAEHYRLDAWYMEPPAPQVPEEISDRQFFQQLAIAGSITQQEALDAVKTGAIPAAISVVVDALPDDQKFAAQMLLSGATIFKRSHPMTAALGAGLGLSSEQIDEIWTAAAQL